MAVRFARQQLAETALQAVKDLLADPNTPPGVGLKAALHILTQAAELPAPQSEHEAKAAQAQRLSVAEAAAPQPLNPAIRAAQAQRDPAELEPQEQQYDDAIEDFFAGQGENQRLTEEFHDDCDRHAELNESLQHSTLFNTSTGFSSVMKSNKQSA